MSLLQPKTPPATVFDVGQRMETDSADSNYEERVEVLEEGAIDASQNFQYSKNQAFDDLMDVLRDDQGAFCFEILIVLKHLSTVYSFSVGCITFLNLHAAGKACTL